jgi:hypothetical protein
MPRYIDKEGNIHTFNQVTSKYNKEKGVFEDFDKDGNLICMELVKDKEMGFNFSSVNSLSSHQKKAMLKKRADKNFKESGLALEKNKMINKLKNNGIQ